MQPLLAAIIKELKILLRDKPGLAAMFAMPILLVIIISSVQHSSYKLVNERKVPLLMVSADTGIGALRFQESLGNIGMFQLVILNDSISTTEISKKMQQLDALAAVLIPKNFSKSLFRKAEQTTRQVLESLGMMPENITVEIYPSTDPEAEMTLFYHPVMEQTFRLSVLGALQSAYQFTQNRQVLEVLYQQFNHSNMPDSIEQKIIANKIRIAQLPISGGGASATPNTSQHNVPAWTIFAMYFIVVTLSTSIVKEKISGCFIRLKTLPTNYFLLLLAKQIVYLSVTILQAIVIFSIGYFLFPMIGLPVLNIPSDKTALLAITFFCGWSAVSYGLAIGVVAKTLEQAIGFGTVSVVILAAIGGVMVPAFAMPETMRVLMKLSPLHWCIEAYYLLFLGSGLRVNILLSIIPLILFIIAMQFLSWWSLKQQNLI
jgi:ABC-2 type transport system permease protein